MVKKYNRIFLVVLDSLGIGASKDAIKFNEENTNTLKCILNSKEKYNLINLEKLGLLNLLDDKNYHIKKQKGISAILNEKSSGKDTLTGHYEMMGLEVRVPSKTFTQTGFPKELINKLEQVWNKKIIGNVAASGTTIINELGDRHVKTKEIIVYTSADSVLQVAAHEDIIPVEELYKMCLQAREITLDPNYLVDRIIARPFIGKGNGNYVRTSNRKDFSLSPFAKTYLDVLVDNNIEVVGVGKIGDIFNLQGISKSIKTKDNNDGMNVLKKYVNNKNFKGLLFINLVDFDSKYGHRRDSVGYLECLESFDAQIGKILKNSNKKDLFIFTADHGNDPCYIGSDHTREMVPLLIYSKSIKKPLKLDDQDNFAVIGATIIDNFNLTKLEHHIGNSLLKEIK